MLIRKLNSNLQIFIFVLIAISIIVPLIQYHIQAFGYLGISALFINDTASYWENIKQFHSGDPGNYYTIIGVLILYYPAIYLGAIYCYFVNFLLLFFSAVVYLKTLSVLKLNFTDKQIVSVFILFLSNFYLWGILFFPNKEIPLLLLTNLLIYAVIAEKSRFFTFAILLAVFFFRDGFAFILAASVMFIGTFKNYIINNPVKTLFIVMFVLMFFSLKTLSALGILSNYSYVIDRNIDYSSEERFASGLPYFIEYIINVLNNSIGYAIRAQILDSNYRIYFHGVGLWHFSVVLVLGLASWINYAFRLPKRNPQTILMAVIICLGLLLLSASSYPQARYMMPFFLWLATGVFFYMDLRTTVFIFLIILLFALLLIILGLSHQLGLGIDIDDFSGGLFFK